MPVPPYVALLSMAAHLHVYHCRETKIEAAFELWDETAQDDHRLAGRKERSHDDLMNQKRTLLMLLTGVTHRWAHYVPAYIIGHKNHTKMPVTDSILYKAVLHTLEL
jgi:hypothetical protein